MTALALGVVGCGYVADFYGRCALAAPDELAIVAAHDLAPERTHSFTAAYGGTACGSLAELLARPGLQAVLNLTPPDAHADVSEAALRAGKHVYSEKPLATDLARGTALVDLATRRGLALGAAPAVHRSPAAEHLLRAVAQDRIGPVSHLYCDLDDGPLHRMDPHTWRSPRGVPWPIHDEFRTGPVLHHLPYALTWATALCGRIEEVKGYSAVAVGTKYGVPAGPDLCIATARHAGGQLSRITVGALARKCRELVVVGRDGELRLPDMWSVDGPVTLDGRTTLEPADRWPYDDTHRLNFHQGLLDLARCVRDGGAARFTGHYGGLALHVLEISLALTGDGACDLRPTTAGPRPLD